MGRIYYHSIACIFCIQSFRQNVRLQSCSAWRQTCFYNFRNTDLHCHMAGCICQCDRGISRIWLYQQFYTKLSYYMLQKFRYGIPTAAYYCRSTCQTHIQDITSNHTHYYVNIVFYQKILRPHNMNGEFPFYFQGLFLPVHPFAFQYSTSRGFEIIFCSKRIT